MWRVNVTERAGKSIFETEHSDWAPVILPLISMKSKCRRYNLWRTKISAAIQQTSRVFFLRKGFTICIRVWPQIQSLYRNKVTQTHKCGQVGCLAAANWNLKLCRIQDCFIQQSSCEQASPCEWKTQKDIAGSCKAHLLLLKISFD